MLQEQPSERPLPRPARSRATALAAFSVCVRPLFQDCKDRGSDQDVSRRVARAMSSCSLSVSTSLSCWDDDGVLGGDRFVLGGNLSCGRRIGLALAGFVELGLIRRSIASLSRSFVIQMTKFSTSSVVDQRPACGQLRDRGHACGGGGRNAGCQPACLRSYT